MPFNPITGVYTPPLGAQNAAPGQVIRSATWNTIFTDIAAALTKLGQSSWIQFPAIAGGVGTYTVLPVFNVVQVNASISTIVMPAASLVAGPIKVMGITPSIFGAFNSVVVPSGGDKFSGQSAFTLTANFQAVTFNPIFNPATTLYGGGYVVTFA